MAENQQAAGSENENQPQFALQRIYIKDLSFESPNSPAVFQEQWQPQVNLDLNTSHKKIGDAQYEVVLSLTITAKIEDKVAYIVEIQQGGVFMIKGIEGPQLGQMLGAYCPTILFPYARESIDGIVNKGSYPSLMLAPVNFDAIYAQALKRQQDEAAGQAAEEQKH
ncbi:MAG: protein-export chaperone SecB [Alteromonadaceae bacterium]|uniref:protein-export chaperone SecB n=1 Tax=unclassified Marinobacter TaxID=83889 RepID=UPI000C6913EB|nr:protein-export chaperone SecB [Marinobacter sp. BGYM27]MAA66665.1 protein-export chaperone SecB [Alteromonadaceae bacterium]MBH86703.1 protein-export chaperone SecB [Alteromonadaceae bacterium]MDG5500746.1 protein-export chaperone SecB [Marinobacter sp. BGYM27]|tara:strand:+ start:376 stop:873 length:498 start_codon:yes stop_codon:yes gene_type:complete